MKRVHLIFKTHLDVGYTDYAACVTERYLKEFIPSAVRVANALRGSDTPFIWTTGSWLIEEALKEDDGSLEQAIRDGLIRWHALPFTTHTELLTPALMEEALSISKRLDERFGVRTVGAKMTDVPGHTVGMLPYLAAHGVRLLHIGVNGATPMPNVPEAFVWRRGDAEITVLYHGGGYGGEIVIGDDIFLFAHTNDNLGPQSIAGVRALYREMRDRYPTAEITASTLEELAERFDPSGLPVITDEIGDSWIHGISTDPYKTAAYRALLRAAGEQRLPSELLLVPEHTWGMCVQRYYPSGEAWSLAEFETKRGTPERETIERSWQEQRDYVTRAAEKLGFDIKGEMACERPCTDGLPLARGHVPAVRLSWQLFSRADFRRYYESYVSIDELWGAWDFTKPGLPEYPSLSVTAIPVASYASEGGFITEMRFPPTLEGEHGLPRFFVLEKEGEIEVRMLGKRASRLPQALWCKLTEPDEPTEIEKLGEWIDPATARCSPLISAIGGGVRSERYEIDSLDCALVAPFGRRLLHYGEALGERDLWFNLYNNIWNTNFPLWFDDDMRFRFRIRRRNGDEK